MDEIKQNDDIENEQDENDQQWAKIQKMIKAVQPGYSISVHRMRPSWCKGYLERLEFLEDDNLDLDYLADTWGGEVLRLRFCDQTGTYMRSVDIPFYSYAPKFRGRVIRRGDINEDRDPNVRFKEPAPMVQQAAGVSTTDTLAQMLGLLKQTRGEDLKVFREIINKVPTDPPVVGNTLSNFIEFAHQFKELRNLFGDAESKLSPENDQTALFQTIGEVVKAMTARPAPNPPRLIQQVPAAILPSPNPQGVQAQSIADRMAALPHDKAAQQFCEALSKMPEEKRENTIKSIFSLLGVENDLNLGSYDAESDDDDDDDDDEPEG